MTTLMRTLLTAAMLCLSAALVGAAAQATELAAPAGVWSGTYDVGDGPMFVRVDFAASLRGDQPGSPAVARLARTDLLNIEVDGARVRFDLPQAFDTLRFEGTLDGGVIEGDVYVNGRRGSFSLHQEVQLELAEFVPLIGSYRLHARAEGVADASSDTSRSRTILIMNATPERPRPAYFEDDHLIWMFPVGKNTFISERGEWLRFAPFSIDERLHIEAQDAIYTGGLSDEYREEQVVFTNGDVHLAGSLLVPAGDGPFPAVALIHGSQGDDRHVYRHYADHFARSGIAALIYDKRGTGGSTGNWRTADAEPLTADALAGIDFLKQHPAIDPGAIGVWGISQGGWLVALTAKQDPDIAFVIGVSVAGVTPGRQEAFRIRNVLADQGLRGIGLELTLLWHRLLYPLGHLATKPYVPLPKSIKDMAGGLAVSPFLNPIPAWRQVHQPVLLIYGEKDYLVDPVESPVLISAALVEGGHAPLTVLTFAAADHSIRMTETGRPSEVLKELRWAPGYFEAKTSWIWSVLGGAAGNSAGGI